jgi:hypothetical protein
VKSSAITASPPTAEAGARKAISPEIVPEKRIVVEIVALISAGGIIPPAQEHPARRTKMTGDHNVLLDESTSAIQADLARLRILATGKNLRIKFNH